MKTDRNTIPKERVATFGFEYDGVQLVPHYSLDGVYVAPGNINVNRGFLQAIGATVCRMMLWPRVYP